MPRQEQPGSIPSPFYCTFIARTKYGLPLTPLNETIYPFKMYGPELGLYLSGKSLDAGTRLCV